MERVLLFSTSVAENVYFCEVFDFIDFLLLLSYLSMGVRSSVSPILPLYIFYCMIVLVSVFFHCSLVGVLHNRDSSCRYNCLTVP